MKIKNAVLHQNVALPGVMAPNMYINPTKIPGIKLEWKDELGLMWTMRDKSGQMREGFFPAATVSAVEIEPGTLEAKSKK